MPDGGVSCPQVCTLSCFSRRGLRPADGFSGGMDEFLECIILSCGGITVMTDRSNAALWRRREKAVAPGVGTMHHYFVDTASNAELVDIEGNRYIDFAAGIAVCNTGHLHQQVVDAVKAQLDRFSHLCFQVTPYEAYIELAEKLNALAPGTSPKKTLFLTSGSEAVENAVKIARARTGRRGIVAFRGGYHGRTLMTMAVTGKVYPYKASFGPMPAEVYHARYPVEYLGVDTDAAFRSLTDVFASDIEPEATAAIIIEPVLGEGGFYMAPPAFMQRLREFCDRHGILLVADEIQSGFARTGKMFAIEHSRIEPDLITVAKALAGGFPLSGVIGKAEIMDAVSPGGLGGTYAGSPLGCVAGLEVLKVIEENRLCERADVIGDTIRERFVRARRSGINSIGDIRGPGAMVAVEFIRNGDPSVPDPEFAKQIVHEASARGVILLLCGIRGNVLRFLPALTISDETLSEGLDIVMDVIDSLHAGSSKLQAAG